MSKRKKNGKMGPIGKFILIGVTCFIAVSLILVFLTPFPAVYVLRYEFAKSTKVAPTNYDTIKAQVDVVRDLTYPSTAKDNKADIFTPKGNTIPLSTIIWVHGGAFVGGDKTDVDYFATCLAADGYAVISINYQLAPYAKFPSPMRQLAEVYKWLETVQTTYLLDLTSLVLAGDSAGAHTVAVFTQAQISEDYADELGVEQVIDPATIKALLLYCGPYSIKKTNNVDNGLLRFFLERAAWAYFGTMEWTKFDNIASPVYHVTAGFPPCFITDGNTGSFEEQARDMVAALEDKGVTCESYFIPKEQAKVGHEFQFAMNTAAGIEAYQRTLTFLTNQL